MGFFRFVYELFVPSKKKDKNFDNFDFDTSSDYYDVPIRNCKSENLTQNKRKSSQDMDDLDFDEMNDVWDED